MKTPISVLIAGILKSARIITFGDDERQLVLLKVARPDGTMEEITSSKLFLSKYVFELDDDSDEALTAALKAKLGTVVEFNCNHNIENETEYKDADGKVKKHKRTGFSLSEEYGVSDITAERIKTAESYRYLGVTLTEDKINAILSGQTAQAAVLADAE
jgi:hypothetical protein